MYYLVSEQQRRWSDCADAQADLRLCCSHIAQQGFSWRGSNFALHKFVVAAVSNIASDRYSDKSPFLETWRQNLWPITHFCDINGIGFQNLFIRDWSFLFSWETFIWTIPRSVLQNQPLCSSMHTCVLSSEEAPFNSLCQRKISS